MTKQKHLSTGSEPVRASGLGFNVPTGIWKVSVGADAQKIELWKDNVQLGCSWQRDGHANECCVVVEGGVQLTAKAFNEKPEEIVPVGKVAIERV